MFQRAQALSPVIVYLVAPTIISRESSFFIIKIPVQRHVLPSSGLLPPYVGIPPLFVAIKLIFFFKFLVHHRFNRRRAQQIACGQERSTRTVLVFICMCAQMSLEGFQLPRKIDVPQATLIGHKSISWYHRMSSNKSSHVINRPCNDYINSYTCRPKSNCTSSYVSSHPTICMSGHTSS